jgi:DNA-binding NarL/FixJ family response regulator
MRGMATKRILLVEDQQISAQALKSGLESLDSGFEVLCVASAEDALKSLEKNNIDLLIADVLLPGISGLELMARFRKRNAHSKVILVSGVHDPEIRKQVARSGAEAFFFKPYEMADLLDAVERLFGIAKSFLASEMDVLKQQPETSAENTDKLADQLAELRFNLQALSVALINERGQIAARAGTLPDEQIESSLMPHLLSVFFAAGRVAAFTRSEPADDLFVVRSADYHLHLASVGTNHALLVASKPLKTARMAALAEAMQKATQRLQTTLLQSRRSKATVPADMAETDPHLEGLLELAETKPMNPRRAEKYWKTATLETPPQGGAISYEQALQLGLAPQDS